MWVLPKTRALLQGTSFTNSFVSTSLCCPSRAAFLSGQYATNNRVPNNTSYGKFDHKNTLAKWLQDSGYHTSLLGKYLNGYNCKKPIPAGWTDWQALCAGIYLQYGFTVKDNGTNVLYDKTNDALNQSDVLASRAVETIDEAVAADKPFFMWVTPTAAHAGSGKRFPSRYANALKTWKLPQGPAFNEADVSDKPAWVRNLAPLTAKQVKAVENKARIRLKTLLAVDDMVETIVNKLDSSGLREDTVVMFTSDNGFMLGEHRVSAGKEVEFEESLRVPLLVSGPGIPVGDNPAPVMNVDHAATIAELAGVTPGRVLDGASWLPALTTGANARRAILHAAPYKTGDNSDGPRHPDYVGIRAGRFTYFELGTGEQELYNLQTDPFQLRNESFRPRHAAVRNQLAAVLQSMRACKGAACNVIVPNLTPTASGGASCIGTACTFDGSASLDPEGELTYSWDFGDGATATGATPSHTYAGSGTYPVTLTVTDDEGAPATHAFSLGVLADNTSPTAAFTSSCTDLECTFDPSGSFDPDPDGAITGYSWEFGDGETGDGPSPVHPYALAGTYAVTLTVTDNRGGTGSVTLPVTVGSG
jgi:arylsulfatase A-like enzyme/chitodextrinase